jgi:hypothetical protein
LIIGCSGNESIELDEECKKCDVGLESVLEELNNGGSSAACDTAMWSKFEEERK